MSDGKTETITWVPVTERKPEPFVSVLFNAESGVESGYFTGDLWMDHRFRGAYHRPTMWADMPRGVAEPGASMSAPSAGTTDGGAE